MIALIENTVTSAYERLTLKKVLTRIAAIGKATIMTIRLILAFFITYDQFRLL